MSSEAGKGSAQRPSQVPQAEFDSNWDRIFGKKDNAVGQKQWHVWMEGYAATGQSARAKLMGIFEGETFEDACDAWVATLSDESKQCYNKKTLRYWGCRLFDNEADARKVFG